MKLLAFTLALCPATAGAAGLEIMLHAGQSLPFYQQTFHYRPIPLPFDVPGAAIEQQGSFEVRLHGGLAVGGSLALVLAKPIAIEARWDTGSASAELRGARYDVTIDLLPPLPSVSRTVYLGSGSAQLEGLRPFSVNLQLRLGSDRIRLVLSGGGSYLPSPGLSVRSKVGLGLLGFDGQEVQIVAMDIQAKDPSSEGIFGGNLGASLHLGLGRRVAIAIDGRAFAFGSRTFEWSAAEGSSRAEAALVAGVLRRIEPVEFTPGSFQLTGGVVFRF